MYLHCWPRHNIAQSNFGFKDLILQTCCRFPRTGDRSWRCVCTQDNTQHIDMNVRQQSVQRRSWIRTRKPKLGAAEGCTLGHYNYIIFLSELFWSQNTSEKNGILIVMVTYSAGRLTWYLNEREAVRRIGIEEGFCTRLVGNICSTPILRPLAHSIVRRDTSAVANTSTSIFNKVIHRN
jgi:hypothetical protein